MSSVRDGLYEAILAHPDDDDLRRVYADWLEEHGEPERSRFIRQQFALARVPEWDPTWVQARYITRELDYPRDFQPDLPQLPDGLSWLGGPYRRGFPAALYCREGVEPLLRSAEGLFALAPVEELELVAPDTWGSLDLAPLATAPWFARISRLTVSLATLDQGSITALRDSPHAATLTNLDVNTCQMPDALGELFRPPLISRLHRLSVHMREEEVDVENLVRSAGGPHRLRSLYLNTGSNHERPAQLIDTGVLAAPLFRGLLSLDLSNNLLGPDGIAELAALPIVDGLQSLSLNWTRIGAEEVEVLASNPLLAGLRRLQLENNGLPSAAALALASSPHLANLRVLTLEKNHLDDGAVVALAGSRHLGGLILLDLAFNQIGDRGAQALIDSRLADGLAYLRVVMNPISGPMKRKLRRRFGERVGY